MKIVENAFSFKAGETIYSVIKRVYRYAQWGSNYMLAGSYSVILPQSSKEAEDCVERELPIITICNSRNMEEAIKEPTTRRTSSCYHAGLMKEDEKTILLRTDKYLNETGENNYIFKNYYTDLGCYKIEIYKEKQ